MNDAILEKKMNATIKRSHNNRKEKKYYLSILFKHVKDNI